ncbi:hypothetical protein BDK51DRAFT_37242 [Blyttiomyces helicus]|uniref:Uncharacterized protein n=1 Tax=Blyttiomyces helicus TaxID=388810 RepID=A0A4P9VWB8_9FUNG|nr:hypothetical protein BDK51DRAFT_37242 [Blyttiomyces helicus]|eukprot:RKO83145.1 hypothetical protein BDK51DRAFT_37242 [Blyttiomyces helicus]
MSDKPINYKSRITAVVCNLYVWRSSGGARLRLEAAAGKDSGGLSAPQPQRAHPLRFSSPLPSLDLYFSAACWPLATSETSPPSPQKHGRPRPRRPALGSYSQNSTAR